MKIKLFLAINGSLLVATLTTKASDLPYQKMDSLNQEAVETSLNKQMPVKKKILSPPRHFTFETAHIQSPSRQLMDHYSNQSNSRGPSLLYALTGVKIPATALTVSQEYDPTTCWGSICKIFCRSQECARAWDGTCSDCASLCRAR